MNQQLYIMKNKLELRPVTVSKEYYKKWNVSCDDYLNLYKNGVKVSDTLYRKGMFDGKVDKPYFLLLKHVEAHYEDSITTDKFAKPHLESQWCIVDNK